jgi:hypothetical protein
MWKGRLLNKAGRLKLVNSVLSSLSTYFLTIFPLKRWAYKKLDKMRKSILWKGNENASGGHCLVRWEKVKRPKQLGGLGVLDLECFIRALRLRWLWYEWVEPDRPWVGSEVPCSESDKWLFRASTVVTVGNGQRASFGDSSWLAGRAPRDIAPNLYKLAWRKRNTVAADLQNQQWTRVLWRMNTAEQMAEFVILWDMVQQIRLSDATDSILWRWTGNGLYSSKSAYRVQFQGSYCSFNTDALWSATGEGKHKLFLWLLVQDRILTADRLLLRHWPCDPVCILCDQADENATHLCLNCVYAREVWVLVSNWADMEIAIPNGVTSTESWWNMAVQGRTKTQRRRIAAILMCTAWNVWKERNRRIFQNIFTTPVMVFSFIKEELQLRVLAWGVVRGLLFLNGSLCRVCRVFYFFNNNSIRVSMLLLLI